MTERTVTIRLGIQDQFGESAPYERLLEKNGITTDQIVEIAKSMLEEESSSRVS